MKKFLHFSLLPALLLLLSSAFAQSNINTTFGNVRFNVNILGPIFNDLNTPRGGFEIPASSGQYSIYASNIWLAANTPSGHRIAAETMVPFQEFMPGPISTDYGPYYQASFSKIWSVTKDQIQYHLAHYTESDYITPEGIASWPGNFHADSASYAEYNDLNNDGVYQPALGEYPTIKGDRCVYYIRNDVAPGAKLSTNTESMQVTVCVYVYAFDNPTPAWLQNTIFVDYRVVNSSNQPWQQARFGVWTDFDLGDQNDDYIGSSTQSNSVFVYNGDDVDGIDSTGYGTTPPAMAQVFLNHSLYTSYHSSADTLEANKAYEYLNKYDENGSLRSDAFMYNGNPFANTGNTEDKLSNAPGNRKVLAGIDLGNLAPGESKCVNTAYLWSRAASGNRLASVGTLNQELAELKTWFNTNGSPCLDETNGIESVTSQGMAVSVYPNPVSDKLYVTTGGSDQIASLLVRNSIGQEVLSGTGSSLNTSGLPSGSYLLEVTNTSGDRKIVKLVK
ncbi:MAG: T9SS type A sorting domain-containing protein [Bacteroidota bacterium]